MKRAGILSLILLMFAVVICSSSVTFAATDGYYQLTQTAVAWDGTDANRQKLTYGDEANKVYTLPWAFLFYGHSYNEINVDTNGNVWFGTTGFAHSFNLASNGRGPVIAAWNNDLSSNYYGGVFVQHKTDTPLGDRVVIEWQTETYSDEGYNRVNDFEVVLFPDGTVRFDYKKFSASSPKDFGSGISLGNGTSSINLTTVSGAYVYTLAGIGSFTASPLPKPVVTTGFATNITKNGATLTGTVNGNGTATTAIFEYGASTAYGNTLSAGSFPAGAGTASAASVLTGLTCNTAYHYRIFATNSTGMSTGLDQMFATSTCPIYAINGSVSPAAGGSITPNDTTSLIEGGSITFTITPKAGYILSNLNDNGAPVTALESSPRTYTYTINNVMANHAVQATFVPAPAPTVSSFTPANGSMDVSPTTMVTATFSEAMAPEAITTESFLLSKRVGIKQLTAGSYYSVALKNDGMVVAWGDSSYGQSTVPAGLSGVTAIAAGNFHAVALKNDGTVIAWGSNSNGQSTVPVGLTGVTAIAAGYQHTVALKSNGTVVAWGSNSNGQTTIPAGLTGVTAIAAGYQHTVALKSNGTVVAWGSNSNGQTTIPVGLTGVVAIAAGYQHTVALKSNGTVVVWGANTYGQSTVPAGLTGVTAIAAGYQHTVALKSNGTVVAWGWNTSGQTTVPAGLTGATGIIAGYGHTMALKNDGTIVAWGANTYGQSIVPAGLAGVIASSAGYGHTVALKNDGTVAAWGYNSYGQATVPAGLGGVTAISAGFFHTTALKSGGTVVAWGDSSSGQSTVPAGLAGVTAIAAGSYHTVALKNDGTVVAWGANTYGQSTVPAGLAGVTAIAAGSYHTVALKSDGTVAAWGYNNYGQSTVPAGLAGVIAIAAGAQHTVVLKNDGSVVAWGDSSYGQSTVPAGLTGVIAIAAGAQHTVVLKSDGSVVAWGDTSYGQSLVPAGLTGVTAISAGFFHTTALKSDGTIVAWGSNTYGQTTVPTKSSAYDSVISGTVTYDAATRTATFTPAVLLAVGTYNVTVAGPRSLAGVPLATQVKWSFAAASFLKPTVTTGSSTNITKNGATLAGTVNDNGAATTAMFEYGASTAYGNTLSAGTVPVGARTTPVVSVLTGLTCNSTYHYRASATNLAGMSTGTDQMFTTSACPVYTINGSANPAVGGSVTPNGSISLTEGGSITFTITPKDGNILSNLSDNGVTVTAIESPLRTYTYTISNVTGNHAVQATFISAPTPTIISFTPANGSTNVVPTATVTATFSDDMKPETITAGSIVISKHEAIKQVAGGDYHTVALRNDGTVVAWGGNSNGQRNVPAGLSGVTAIAASHSHTVALKNDGTVVAWGYNSNGQCTVPAGLNGVTTIAAGYQHTVVLKNDGTVVAWGDNSKGQSTVPAGLTGVTAIAAGSYHTVALKSDGTVIAWGDNSYGQTTVPAGLSGVTAISAGLYHTVALKNDGTVIAWGRNDNSQVTIPAGLNGVTAIAAGYYHTVTLKNNGTVVAWGSNTSGQTTVPAGLTGVSAIGAGYGHTMAVKNDGTLAAWGSNSYGQTTVPAGFTGVTAIAAGIYYTVALKNDGTVVTWGDNRYGVITLPVGLTDVTAITVGHVHSVALKNNGTVVAWGDNSSGQSTVPVGLSGVTAIAAGRGHTVALKNDGTVVAWGSNSNGQITVPAGLTGVTAVAAKFFHTVALKSDGTVVAWGDNSYGQTTVPAGLTGVTAIATGFYHTVALKSDGTVVVWGDNSYGQSTVPAGLTGVTAVVAGPYSTVAVKSDGTVVAWGNSYVPAGLTGVTAIAAGIDHAVALYKDGLVVAWGSNAYSQATVPPMLSVNDSVVNGIVTYNSATRTATFTPTVSLVVGTYNVTVAGPRSLAGSSLASQAKWSFTVSPALKPSVTTGSAANITKNGATLAGTVNDNGAATTALFEYGPSIDYGNTLSAGSVPAGSGVSSITSALTSLTCNSSYHYRISATNVAGTSTGTDQVFTTSACPVYTINGSVSPAAGGSITPNGTTSLIEGGSLTFTITPNGAYILSNISDNGATVTVIENPPRTYTYSINNVTSNHTVQVTFVPDATKPTISGFTLPATATSLVVPVTTFTATDNIAVTGYLITESSITPVAGATGWTSIAPTSYTAATSGSHILYPWVKDAAGNVSAVFGTPRNVVITLPDAIKPTVSVFTMPSMAFSFTVSVTSFTATDNIAVTGYLITESSTPPTSGTTGWTAVAPTSYTAATSGSHILYPWVKDAAGNVSVVFGTPRTVLIW